MNSIIEVASLLFSSSIRFLLRELFAGNRFYNKSVIAGSVEFGLDTGDNLLFIDYLFNSENATFTIYEDVTSYTEGDEFPMLCSNRQINKTAPVPVYEITNKVGGSIIGTYAIVTTQQSGASAASGRGLVLKKNTKYVCTFVPNSEQTTVDSFFEIINLTNN